jgi:hypothetical protein
VHSLSETFSAILSNLRISTQWSWNLDPQAAGASRCGQLPSFADPVAEQSDPLDRAFQQITRL